MFKETKKVYVSIVNEVFEKLNEFQKPTKTIKIFRTQDSQYI